MNTTYASAMLSTMTRAIQSGIHLGPLRARGVFKRIDFHTTADGSRAVLRDLNTGQDYEITVKPLNQEG